MDENSSNANLIAAWRAGDETAARLLFGRYAVRLAALARARLSRRLARRVDPDDILQSACRSFFLGARAGRFQPGESGDLWPLLAALTLRKLARAAERHQAAARDGSREDPRGADLLAEAIAADPTPEQAAVLAEELTEIFRALPAAERAILERALRGEVQAEIAKSLGCADRTVRRALVNARHVLSARYDGQSLDLDALGKFVQNTFVPSGAAEAECSPAPAPKSELGGLDPNNFRLLEFAGQGGFGKVYRAFDRSASRTVAVKYLHKSLWQDPAARESIAREAQALRDVEHPQIVSVQGWGMTPAGGAFLVRDWIAGPDLCEWQARHAPPPEDVLALLRPIATALAAMHALGIWHCDLKPSNMLLRADGQPVLTDFGLAESAGRLFPDGRRGGTPGFFAPEQVSPAFGAIGPRTDVYGWGATLFALLAGRPPWLGAGPEEIVAGVVSSLPAPRLRTLNPAVPETIESLVAGCLAKDAAARPQSLAEIK